MDKNLNIGIIGLGCRGMGLLNSVIFKMKDINVLAVCDVYQDRIDDAKKQAKNHRRNPPDGYTDYKELLERKDIEAVIVASSWASHTPIVCHAMRKGKMVASEVGGAYTIDECWELVRCQQETKAPYMVLENCCYGEYELAVLKMVREGLFGEVVHCEGAYRHDLRREILGGNKNRHYRLEEYKNRNCENYPTHEIGPIAKILDINNGNRFVSLVSVASKSVGLKSFINDNKKDYQKEFENIDFCQSDVVDTLITCHNGETIRITLDTTLPRYYSRSFTINGTKAMYTEDGNSFFFDNMPSHRLKEWRASTFFNNGKKFVKKYRHPIWKWFKKKGVTGGHGGMDYLVLKAFFDSCKRAEKIMPLDIYDAVSWMVITALSEESIKSGQKVMFPDFTEGKWAEKNKPFDMLGLNN